MEETVDEVKNLKACVSNLISVLALPAMWSGGEPRQIISALLDVLLGMLRLDFVYAGLRDPDGGVPTEVVRLAQTVDSNARAEAIGEALNPWLGAGPDAWPLVVRNPNGDGDIWIAPFRLGLKDEMGVLVAGSRRTDFPSETERLLLNVAANQAAIGLQEARLLCEQRRVAEELDQKVAQRTEELRRSEFYLAEGQRLAHMGSWAFDPSGFYDHWSQELFRIYGFDPAKGAPTLAEYVGAVHPQDREFMAGTIRRMLAEGLGCDLKKRILRPDGELRYIRCVGVPVIDNGVLKSIVGTAMDVTEQELLTQELRRREE